jgi:dipeptidyl aminopeptidase/acylaminoacyl peptidase
MPDVNWKTIAVVGLSLGAVLVLVIVGEMNGAVAAGIVSTVVVSAMRPALETPPEEKHDGP